MAQIYPFKSLLSTSKDILKIAAPPYDVVTRAEAAILARDKPLSFLRVSRSEIELDDNVDPYSDVVYHKASDNFKRLRKNAPLQFDHTDSFYLYSLVMNGHRQTGLVVAASVDEYDNDRIKKHELTRKMKEDDRTAHTVALSAHTGPVFLTYKPVSAVDELVDRAMQEKPLFNFQTEDEVTHQAWRVPAEFNDLLIQYFRDVDSLYVADGHHRAKSASRVRESCRSKNSNHSGNEAYNRFLSVIFPSNQLQILPYNRAVQGLNGHTPETFLKELKKSFVISETDCKIPESKGQIHFFLANKWFKATRATSEAEKSITDTLDVSILQETCLRPILGIDDPRTNERIQFIGGIHGPEKLETIVASHEADVAFSMYPVTLDDLMEVSDNNLIMPPKSTWFEPKLRDGVFIHCF